MDCRAIYFLHFSTTIVDSFFASFCLARKIGGFFFSRTHFQIYKSSLVRNADAIDTARSNYGTVGDSGDGQSVVSEL